MVDLGCRINSDKADYLFKIFKEYDYFFVEPYKEVNQCTKNLSNIKTM